MFAAVYAWGFERFGLQEPTCPGCGLHTFRIAIQTTTLECANLECGQRIEVSREQAMVILSSLADYAHGALQEFVRQATGVDKFPPQPITPPHQPVPHGEVVADGR